MTQHFLSKDTALPLQRQLAAKAGTLSGILSSALRRQGTVVTQGQGTQSQNNISASGACVASVGALMPNNGFQATFSRCARKRA